MTAMTEDQEKDWQFALEISRDTRSDPHSPYVNKLVGVFQQQVIATADSLEEMESKIKSLGIGTHEALVIEASVDYERTYMIWSLNAAGHMAFS
ncbi:MAG: hypothetical protein JO316_16500 [Abitibacteriaceae bacterium]|nr:hypothetical protein [Abditibacteriaceae bacterium]